MRLGLYGGTFDPIHLGHIAVAREAVRAFSLDRLLIIPNHRPPHKQGGASASYEDRLEMARLACRDESKLEASDLERNTGRSYTIETLLKLESLVPESLPPYFVIGADAYADVPSWHRWREVLPRLIFIVVTRPGHQITPVDGARAHVLDTLSLEISSSNVRKALAAGKASPYLDPAVLDYIRSRGLYAAA